MQDFCGGPLWDSELTWSEATPDFTECFQLTVLVWTPCAFLWGLLFMDIYFLVSSKHGNIPWGFINTSKLVTTFLLIALSCIDLGMAIDMKESQGLHPVHVVTPAIKIVTFVLAATLIYLNKRKGIRTSGLLTLFWFFLIVFAIPQYRTEINNYSARTDVIGSSENLTWEDFQFVSYMIYFPLILISLGLNFVADRPPTYCSYESLDKPSPGLSASFPSKLFFGYFDKFAWTGYKKPLEMNDIWDLNPENTSTFLVPKFDKYWLRSVEKARLVEEKKSGRGNAPQSSGNTSRQTNGSIFLPIFKAFGAPFWAVGVLKLIIDVLSFASPQILDRLIAFTAGTAPYWQGIIYAFALFGVAILTAILNATYSYISTLVGFRTRTAIISAIYRKALKMSSHSKKDTTVGEIVNLMAVDANRFYESMPYLHLLWSSPLIIGLAIYFLWQIIGASVMAGFGVMILLIPINGVIAMKLSTFQVAEMAKKDERVKTMNEILSGMKVLKLYAWEPSFGENVKTIRSAEIGILKKSTYFMSGTYFIWTMSPFLVSLASFATYVLVDPVNNVLDAQTAFVALALFNLLSFPVTMFPMMISYAIQLWVSVKRINKFMNCEEVDPNNVSHKPSEYSLSIVDGEFTWGDPKNVILKKVNIQIPKNSLQAVVGPVACGKSSLISAFLGEMEKNVGQVNSYGSIAYVSQQAWIQNATLKDNILFGKKLDQKFYDKIVEACALKSDLEMLPGGDQTEIGEKGINLSGGQKQRISLARAVYNDADIYLFDDPLSAVDSHVGKHIFDNVIGPNSLLTNKTRLLVTHGISFLPYVDNISVMKDGEITESGSYISLLEQKGAFADFLIEHLNEMEEDDEELENIKKALALEPGQIIKARTDSESSESAARLRRSSSNTSSNNDKVDVKKVDPVVNDGTTLIEEEEAAVGQVGIAVYIKYFKNIGMKLFFAAVVLCIFNQGFSVYSNIWLTRWSSDPDSSDPAVRDMYLLGYGGFGVGQAITICIFSVLLGVGCLNAAKNLHNRLLTETLRLPMSFFDTTPLGRIMNRFSKDVDIADNTIPMMVRELILMSFTTLAILIVISIVTPIFLAVIIPLGILYYFIQQFYIATSRQLKRLESITRSPIYSHFSESVTGQSIIRAYRVQDRFVTTSENRVDHNQKCTYPGVVASQWLAIRLEIIGSFVILFSALFSVLGRETISPALVGLSITYALQITQILSWLVMITSEVETNIVAIERMEEYANLPKEAPWIKGEIDKTWPTVGRVDFVDFQFRYREGLELVLKGITFSVMGSQKIGIVGRTGAGKSSLTIALFRIIESAGGKILIDGKDIAELGLHNLRQRLTIIPQDPVLFSGSLRMNIDPFNIYSDDEVWNVLEQAHLKTFATGLASGLLHEIAEGGENISIGQRQLICLARALLRKTKILILDEATAAIDLETDVLIQNTIKTEFKDCTILTIAHRLNTIIDSDKVIVLDKGMVVEFESPSLLLQDKTSMFYGMAKDAGLV